MLFTYPLDLARTRFAYNLDAGAARVPLASLAPSATPPMAGPPSP